MLFFGEYGENFCLILFTPFFVSQQIACQPTNHVRSLATSGIVVLCILVHRKYFSSSSSFPTYLYGFPLGEIFEKTSSFQHMRTSTTMAKLHHLLRWWWLRRLLRVKTKTFRSHHENWGEGKSKTLKAHFDTRKHGNVLGTKFPKLKVLSRLSVMVHQSKSSKNGAVYF